MAVKVQQFHDAPLGHFSYAIAVDGQGIVVDPGRDPRPYLEWLAQQGARLTTILETHPHADFASSHLELKDRTGATIYINPRVRAEYPHQPLDDGDEIQVGNVTVRALFTPGHSPDHNSYLLLQDGQPIAVFTGDSLFIGDVGRPDLREEAGALQARREELARQMFHTIHKVFASLPDNVVVYPTHGKGSLCGRNMGEATHSTIGQEKQFNWAFQVKDEDEFVARLLADQPFIPAYFPYDVEVNRRGAPHLATTMQNVPLVSEFTDSLPIVDIRSAEAFRQGHIPGSINIPDVANENVETWIGTFFKPGDRFYLVGDDEDSLNRYLYRIAKIYYEPFVAGMKVLQSEDKQEAWPALPLEDFRRQPEAFTIVDVRTPQEVKESGPIFPNSLNIPLNELSDRHAEIPTDKPVVFHCAGGYRSDVALSLWKRFHPEAEAYSLGAAIKEFKQ